MKRVALGALIGGTLTLLMGVSLKAAIFGVVMSFVVTMAIRERRLHKEAA